MSAAASPLSWTDEHHLRVGSCDFFCRFPLRAVPDGHLPVLKPREAIEAYAELAAAGPRPNIVELGIKRGGSTALLRELFRPQKLVAVELAAEPALALTRYIAEQSQEEVVHPYYGVDQADRARLTEILDAEFGDQPLDLVVDDASHRYVESVASFEVLFPRLRPGGHLLLEDWLWEHVLAGGMQAARQAGGEQRATVAARVGDAMAERTARGDGAPTPFSQLVIELVLARACSETVASLQIGPSWVGVERGEGDLDPDSFRLGDLYHDHFAQVASRS